MNYTTHLFQSKYSKTDIGNTIKTFSETKQHQVIENILPINSVHTTQEEFGKETYQFLLNVLQGMPKGSVLILSVKESADKETSLVVQHQRDTEGSSQSVLPAHSSLDEPLMANIYDYIATHIEKESLTIDDLTHACAMSRSQLFRKIKTLTAKTPAQLIRDYRLDMARRLFQSDKTKRVSEVMFAVGFNDAKHFGQIFKQRFGVSPQGMKK